MFEDSEFLDACQELEEPLVDGWEYLASSHDVRVYRIRDEVVLLPTPRSGVLFALVPFVAGNCETQPEEYIQIQQQHPAARDRHRSSGVLLRELKSGLYHYKIYGTIETPPEVCAEVYMDLEYRKKWDTYAKELFKKEIDGEEYIYWNVKYPVPLFNRDYVYCRKLKELEYRGSKVWVVLARSKNNMKNFPEKWATVRVDEYIQSLALTYNKNSGSKAFIKYFDNPKGIIPTWLINWVISTGMPEFLAQMQRACENYKNYNISS